MNQYHANGYPELYFCPTWTKTASPAVNPDKGTMAQHTDGSWRPETGQATIMYAVEVPETGGERILRYVRCV